MGGDAAASSMPLLYKQPLGGQTLGASSQQASLAPRTSYEGRRSPIPGMGINLESFPLAGILALMPQQQDCNRVEPDLDIGSSGMTDWQGQNQVVQGMGGLPGEGTLRSQESDLLPFSMAVMQDLTPGLDFQVCFASEGKG